MARGGTRHTSSVGFVSGGAFAPGRSLQADVEADAGHHGGADGLEPPGAWTWASSASRSRRFAMTEVRRPARAPRGARRGVRARTRDRALVASASRADAAPLRTRRDGEIAPPRGDIPVQSRIRRLAPEAGGHPWRPLLLREAHDGSRPRGIDPRLDDGKAGPWAATSTASRERHVAPSEGGRRRARQRKRTGARPRSRVMSARRGKGPSCGLSGPPGDRRRARPASREPHHSPACTSRPGCRTYATRYL